MSLRDQIVAYAKRNDWVGCDAFLAGRLPADNSDERSCYAYWSVRTQLELCRFEDALRRLDGLAGDFQSRCAASYLRSEIFWKMGDQAAAVEALRSAPWGAEMDRFPALAAETMFLYCYLLAASGREPPPKLVDTIPDDYHAILFDGRRIGRGDLMAAIEQTRRRRQSVDG